MGASVKVARSFFKNIPLIPRYVVEKSLWGATKATPPRSRSAESPDQARAPDWNRRGDPRNPHAKGDPPHPFAKEKASPTGEAFEQISTLNSGYQVQMWPEPALLAWKSSGILRGTKVRVDRQHAVPQCSNQDGCSCCYRRWGTPFVNVPGGESVLRQGGSSSARPLPTKIASPCEIR